MGKKDSRVDAYITESADFARPILEHIRQVVHAACPEVKETIKWGFPHFEYKGILCSMAAFKQHCALGFWKGAIMADPYGLMSKVGETAMGQFGRISSLSDLPDHRQLTEYIREAGRLNEADIKVSAKPKPEARDLNIPPYFMEAVRQNQKALETFEHFSYSNKKEYVEWITEAKTEATRQKRLKTAVEWMAEGKIRNWKYIK